MHIEAVDRGIERRDRPVSSTWIDHDSPGTGAAPALSARSAIAGVRARSGCTAGELSPSSIGISMTAFVLRAIAFEHQQEVIRVPQSELAAPGRPDPASAFRSARSGCRAARLKFHRANNPIKLYLSMHQN